MGLSKQLIGMDTISHIERVAEDGDLSKIDLLINDIVKKDMGTMAETMTASNFGKVSDLATKSDLALGIINMVFETVGMMSIFAARTHGLKDIVLIGNLTSVKQAPRTFETLNKMFDVNFIIPENSEFATVIGSALAGITP
jgi:type II pantothenate kinase